MSNFNSSTRPLFKGDSTGTQTVKSTDSVSIKQSKKKQEPPAEKVFEAHLTPRTAAKDYFYASAGAFAEGHYTEF